MAKIFRLADWLTPLFRELIRTRKERKGKLGEITDIFGDPIVFGKYYFERLHQRVVKRPRQIRSVSYGWALAGLFGDWITSSTRRLRRRPVLLSFDAIGWASP